MGTGNAITTSYHLSIIILWVSFERKCQLKRRVLNGKEGAMWRSAHGRAAMTRYRSARSRVP